MDAIGLFSLSTRVFLQQRCARPVARAWALICHVARPGEPNEFPPRKISTCQTSAAAAAAAAPVVVHLHWRGNTFTLSAGRRRVSICQR